MARHETSSVWHTCDVCGAKCEPVEKVEIVRGWGQDGNAVTIVVLRPTVYISYGTTRGEVCKACLHAALREWLEREGAE
jgi:hypothetical protein